MKNWKTTAAGLLVGLAMAFNTLVTNHQALTLGNALPVVGSILFGLVSKDHDVTGGTTQQ